MADPRIAQESHKLTEQKTALLRSAVERRMTDKTTSAIDLCSHAGSCADNLRDHDGAFCANLPSITGERTMSDLVERVERAIAAALKPYNGHIGRGENAHEWIARRCAEDAARAAIEASEIETLREALSAEILRLVDALVYAHEMGVEWPSDPLPFGSIAHNLFIERGNDPERIAALTEKTRMKGLDDD